jgi:arylsulfatase A-like enzyme
MEMNPARIVKGAAMALLLTACLACGDEPRPNVVIFFTDDQGTLDANCYGSTDLHTPAMDELAATGVRFTQAYAHMVCCPARAMLLTGRYPQRSNVNWWTQGNATTDKHRNMFRGEVTLAEVLRGAGYRTALFGKWHLGAHADHGPTEQGFDEFTGLLGGFIDNYNHYYLHGDGFHDLYEGKRELFLKGKYFPDLITERATDFIDRNREVPFLLMVSYNIPHYPEQADPKFNETYEHLEMPRQSYAKIISTTDDRMQQVMDRLEQRGLRENTIIVFMSDNGHSTEDFAIRGEDHNSGLPEGLNYGANGGGGNTGRWIGHKLTYFEGGILVPAIISYPAKLPQGIVRDQAITAMDWMPTILDLCGVSPPDAKLDGYSLLPIIQSNATRSGYEQIHWQWNKDWAVREGEWKLIVKADGSRFLGKLSGPLPERRNYINAEPDIVKRLQALHDEWLNEVDPRGALKMN